MRWVRANVRRAYQLCWPSRTICPVPRQPVIGLGGRARLPVPARLFYLPSMANDPYFGDLYKRMAITDADLDAAVDAVMADPTTARFSIGEEYTADLAAAVAASPYAQDMLADPGSKDGSKRAAVRTAILMTRPVRR